MSGPSKHGSLLLGLWDITSWRQSITLSWTPSHPERSKSQHTWTEADWGIHMAHAIAGSLDALPQDKAIQFFHYRSMQLSPQWTAQMGHPAARIHGRPPVVRHWGRGRHLEWKVDQLPIEIPEAYNLPVSQQNDFSAALNWINGLTGILQHAQRVI